MITPQRGRNRPVSPGALARAMAVLAAVLAWGTSAPAQDGPPRLLVIVAVDQMRADYLTRFAAQWTGGFKRLLADGMVFERTLYPYLNTVTCAGHATLGTGALPRTHGVILNAWYRRNEQRLRACTADDSVRSVPYGGKPESLGHSAAQLLVPTLAERLRERWPDSRSVTLSLKARSAIMMAGKSATAVTWMSPSGWQTSTAYASQPVPSIAKRVAGRAPERDRSSVWQRLGPLGAYPGLDVGVGERPLKGWIAIFPHPLAGLTPDAPVHDLWETSPYSDDALGALAADAVEDFALGQRGTTVDFLGVSFSATDLVGHDFGPDSHEVADTLWRLDRTLGTLMDVLDRKVGRRRYALALSADHGVAPIPEARTAVGLPAGRVPTSTITAAVERALGDTLGTGPHVARTEYSEVYLRPATREKMTPAAAASVIAAIRALQGIHGAVWTPSPGPATDGDAAVRPAILAGFYTDRSGDFTVAPAPYWFLVPGANPNGGSAATHGSLHEYDQHVPLVFYGARIPPGRRTSSATPADLAPTLASTVGLQLSGVDGRALPLVAAR